MEKIFIIAGEASGDLHGANLARALFQRNPDLDIRGWGGDLMADAGVQVLSHYRDRSLMGFVEVIVNWRKIRSWLKKCKEQIREFDPDTVVLIDYGGFNLRMARYAHNLSYHVHYYIPPKAWAWNKKRVKKLAQYTDDVSCILPFEEHWFRAYGVNARFVGNPLIKFIRDYNPDEEFRHKHQLEGPYIALLPGSRYQEIKRILPEMIRAGKAMNGYDLALACAPGIPEEFYQQFDLDGVTLLQGKTYDILEHCEGAIVTSGTATLETALMEVPQVVVYKASPISFFIGKMVIKVPFISLVNLILNKEAVPELIQNDATASNISGALVKVMGNHSLKLDYEKLRELLTLRNASAETADRILDYRLIRGARERKGRK